MRPVAPPPIVDDWPPDPDDTPEDGLDEPEPDPPELVLDPLRGDADPDLVADDDGVREPLGVWTRGGSATREGADEPPELVDSPEEPEDPDEPDPLLVRGIACSPPEPAGPAGALDEPDSAAVRGIACAIAAAGAANAIARATTTKRGFLSMCIYSFNRKT